jgi:hypothetical protein
MALLSHTRGWWRELFVDHPGVAARNPDGYLGNKHKVWCARCFPVCIAAEVVKDEHEVGTGIQASICDQQTIESTCVMP